MTSTSISAEFQAEFARLKTDVESAITTSPSSAAQCLLTLRQAFISAHTQLPPYDQKKYEREIRDLEAKMDVSRANKPKARFTFKRTPNASRPSTPASSASAEGAGPSTAGTSAGGKEKKDEGYTIANVTGRVVTEKDITPSLTGSERDITLTLSSLEHCLVDLRACPLRNLHIDRLSSCLLLLSLSPVGVLAHRLTTCLLSVPNCAQFRLHDSTGVVLCLGIQSYPVIEGCRSIFTMPSPSLETGEGQGQGEEAGGEGRWNKVQDFDSPTGSSTNWRALTPNEQISVASAIGTSTESGNVDTALASIP